MKDIEKVIKSLQCCVDYYINNDLTGHERCPYNGINGGDGCNKLYEDALELLKEYQEKIETARKWLKEDSVDIEFIAKRFII